MNPVEESYRRRWAMEREIQEINQRIKWEDERHNRQMARDAEDHRREMDRLQFGYSIVNMLAGFAGLILGSIIYYAISSLLQ